MTHDMKTTLTRLFTVIMLIMVSMGAKADVKVLFGEKGESTFKSDGGTIEVKQETSKEDATKVKVTVYLIVTPNKGYTMKEKDGLEVYAAAPANINPTRAPQASEKLTLDCEDFKDDASPRTYHVDIDPNLALWVKSADFQKKRENGAKFNPFDLTTDADETDGKESLYYMELSDEAVNGFFAIPHDENFNNNNDIRLTTSNMPNLRMLWYFKSAGVENSVQYYYIVNKSTGKYMNLTGSLNTNNTIKLSRFTGENDSFKFFISGSPDQWVIYPKSGNGSYWVNKQGGCVSYGNTNGSGWFKSSNYGNAPDVNSIWRFVAKDAVTFAHPFTNSTEIEKHYYFIRNKHTNTYYLSTDNGYASASTADNTNKVWYFVEAASDANIPNLKYYYIVNANTDKYIYFDGTTSGSTLSEKVKIETYPSDGKEEDGYQFAVLNAKGNDYSAFTIMPKKLIGLYYNKSTSLGGSNKTTLSENLHIYTINDRGENKNTAHWAIESATTYTNFCEAPTISYSNDTKEVTIASGTDGAAIRYTIDGTTVPTRSIGTEYSAPISTITETTTVKAIAYKDGMGSSVVTTETIVKVATPSVINNGTQIVISCETEGATKYYSIDGGAYTEYNDNAPLAASSYLGKTITAKATKTGCIDSETFPLHIDATCYMPTFTLNYQTGAVTIASETSGATIYYTLDGTDPNNQSTPFSSLILTEAKTVKAIAYKEGFSPSAIASITYSQVATPTIQNNGSNAISITCATDGAEIRYLVGGDNPDHSSTLYDDTPLKNNVSNKTIKAKAFKTGMVPSSVGENTVTLQCNKPVITKGANLITISCDFPASGYTIYYSDDGSDPTTEYPEGGIPFTEDGFTIKAIATATDYSNSDEVSKLIMQDPNGEGTADNPYIIHEGEFDNFVAKAEEEPGAYFRLAEDVEATSKVITTPFSGTLEAAADAEGNYYKISDLTHALFNTISGGTVKNVVLDGVNITTGSNVGAIANVVEGTSTKIASIYNCGILSGSVGGSDYVGGIVGLLGNTTDDSKCYARVINCYSYANITAGSDKGGIVGGNSYASKSGDIRTMVMNCMFYGSITTGGSVSPVYGGLNISNLNGDTEAGLNTYNYYRYETNKKNINAYNSALAAKDQYLIRFELYRQLLNGNRKLAAWYATGNANKGVGENNEMAKWVLDKSIAPYPILKEQAYYPSVVNYDPLKYYDDSGNEVQRSNVTERNKGKILGELTVNVSVGSHGSIKAGKEQITLKRIDKDFDNYNFNYDKVQLPYFNEVGEGNYTGGWVVTGWKVTVTGGFNSYSTTGYDVTYDSNGKATNTPYNFADRNCTEKDNYNNSKRVFSQGAYFDVPYGVSEISIEAYWGKAAYVCDKYYDVVYKVDFTSGSNNITDMGTQGNPLLASGQTIYSSVSTALGTLTGVTNPTVYDYAIVLVGNMHLNDVPSVGTKPFTIMSADFDNDNEPDYSLIYTHIGSGSNGRKDVSPIRFDFVNVPGMAMAQKPNNATLFRNVSIFNPKGWFEVTNTCQIAFTQLEYDNGGKTAAPLILLGGEYEQIVSTKATNLNATDYKLRTTYIHVGSNAYFKEFNNGTHTDGWYATPHVPISATGGDYDKFYLSGAYRADAAVAEDDAEGYISGGRFGEVAGAGQQQIDGNVYWQIYDADITDFYGGGVNSDKPITGNITVDIFNSHVTTYCGGPKFGDMQKQKDSPITITYAADKAGTPTTRQSVIGADRTVTTNATGCEFGNFYGAGYGGISYVRKRTHDSSTYNFGNWAGEYTNNKGKYFDGEHTSIGNSDERQTAGPGVAVDFDYEFFVWSAGTTGGRFYIKYASLSFATTNGVTSTLNDCDITGSFYGGGRLGKVDGTINSTLNGCRVTGDVFGAGYSADRPKVPYRDGGFETDGVPTIDTDAGVFSDGVKSTNVVDLDLNPGQPLSNATSAIGTAGKIDTNFTEDELKALGTVSDVVTLNINNYKVNGNTIQSRITGDVFGGGAMSKTTSNVNVNISGGSVGNVYGGGDLGAVGGNTIVTLSGNATINGNVFGGGNKAVVSGAATVNIVEQ